MMMFFINFLLLNLIFLFCLILNFILMNYYDIYFLITCFFESNYDFNINHFHQYYYSCIVLFLCFRNLFLNQNYFVIMNFSFFY